MFYRIVLVYQFFKEIKFEFQTFFVQQNKLNEVIIKLTKNPFPEWIAV